MQTEINDPIFPALAVMRTMQDKLFEADDRLPGYEALKARLRALETSALMTRPATRAGALELLRYCSVEIRCDVFDRELVADAIDHCAAVLERNAEICNY